MADIVGTVTEIFYIERLYHLFRKMSSKTFDEKFQENNDWCNVYGRLAVTKSICDS